MKKLLAIATLATGISALAASEKAFTVQCAAVDEQVKAATTIGQLVGYPMLGTMASMGLADNDLTAMFGQLRQGENGLLEIYCDAEKMATFDDMDEAFAFSFLCAPGKSRQEFFAANEGKEEKDGVVKLDDDEFVAYSADGKWAALASSAELAKTALSGVTAAKAPMDGDFVRFEASKTGMEVFAKIFALSATQAQASGADVSSMQAVAELLRTIATYRAGLRVAADGLFLHVKLSPVPGSDLASVATVPLEGDALAFAPADAVYAVSVALNSSVDGELSDAVMKEVVAFLEEGGVKTGWMKFVCENGVSRLSIDLKAMVAYFAGGEAAKALKALDPAKFQARFQKFSKDSCVVKRDTKPCAVSVSLGDCVDAGTPVSALFAQTLPEAAAKKPAIVGIYRYYSVAKAVAPLLVDFVPGNGASILKAGIATLPSDAGAASAGALYREGDDLGFIARVSAGEIKGIAAVFSAGVAYYTMLNAEDCECDADDDGDDDAAVGE